METIELLEQLKAQMIKKPLGNKFEKDNCIDLTKELTSDILKNISYNVSIYEQNEYYYFVDDKGIIVYIGKIDAEGSVDTIKKDINKYSVLINTCIALIKDDKKMLNTILNHPFVWVSLINEIKEGANK